MLTVYCIDTVMVLLKRRNLVNYPECTVEFLRLPYFELFYLKYGDFKNKNLLFIN